MSTAAYQRQYYMEHPELKPIKARRSNAAREKFRTWVNVLKSVPCMDCGNSFPPWVMDFDHVRGDKINEIAQMTTYRKEIVLVEIAKCDIVCANCHRDRTYRRHAAKSGLGVKVALRLAKA